MHKITEPGAGADTPSVAIVAQHDGYRCCGVEHGRTVTLYPKGYFTADQLDTLRADRELLVGVQPEPIDGPDSAPPDGEGASGALSRE